MKFWGKAEQIARHVAYIAFFALLLSAMHRFGTSAKAFVGGLSVGIVLGSIGVLLFLVQSTSKDEREDDKSKEKSQRPG